MSIVMNMSSYEVERDSMEAEGSEEAGYKNWSTPVALMCQQQLFAPSGRQMTIPIDLVAVDAELFLQKMDARRR